MAIEATFFMPLGIQKKAALEGGLKGLSAVFGGTPNRRERPGVCNSRDNPMHIINRGNLQRYRS